MALPWRVIGLAQICANRPRRARGRQGPALVFARWRRTYAISRRYRQGEGGRPPMSYVRKVLLPGEQVIYETGLHWLVYGRAIVLFVAAAALSVAALYVPHDSQNMALGKNLVLGVAGVVL